MAFSNSSMTKKKLFRTCLDQDPQIIFVGNARRIIWTVKIEKSQVIVSLIMNLRLRVLPRRWAKLNWLIRPKPA